MLTKTEREYLEAGNLNKYSKNYQKVLRHRIKQKLRRTQEDLYLMLTNKEKWLTEQEVWDIGLPQAGRSILNYSKNPREKKSRTDKKIVHGINIKTF